MGEFENYGVYRYRTGEVYEGFFKNGEWFSKASSNTVFLSDTTASMKSGGGGLRMGGEVGNGAETGQSGKGAVGGISCDLANAPTTIDEERLSKFSIL